MKKHPRVDERKGQHGTSGVDALWAERWERLGAANEAARRERLMAFTLEGAIREFEDLCREIHVAFDTPSTSRSHPVGLVKFTRGEQPGR